MTEEETSSKCENKECQLELPKSSSAYHTQEYRDAVQQEIELLEKKIGVYKKLLLDITEKL